MATYSSAPILAPSGGESVTVVGPDGLPFEPVEAYLHHLRIVGLAPNTIRSYATSLAQWFIVLDAHGRDWRRADRSDVDRFITALRGGRSAGALAVGVRQRSAATVNTRLAPVTEFYRHHMHVLPGLSASLRSALTAEPSTGEYRPMLGHLRRSHALRRNGLYVRDDKQRPTKFFSPPEMERILAGLTSLDARDRFLTVLASETGLRAGEMLTLRHGAFRTAGVAMPSVEVVPTDDHPRGARCKSAYRKVFVSDRVVRAYEDYVWMLVDLGIVEHVPDLQDHFVLVNLRAEHRFRPMSYGGLQDRIPTITRACPGPLPDWSWHMFRHTHATALLLSGVPDHVVANRLGHASPTTTLDIYAHITDDAEIAAMKGWDRYMGGVTT